MTLRKPLRLPPYAEMLGVNVDRSGDGSPVLTMPFGEGVIGRPGFVHGGALSGLIEIAALAALFADLSDPDARVKPVNLTVDFMRGARDKPTYAQGTVRRIGKRIANVDAIAWQDDRDKPVAAARMNYLIVRGE